MLVSQYFERILNKHCFGAVLVASSSYIQGGLNLFKPPCYI